MIKEVEMLLSMWILEGDFAHFSGKIRKRTETQTSIALAKGSFSKQLC